MPLIKMERYTLQERIEIFKIHYENGENLAETVRKTGTFWVKKLVEKFELLGQVTDVKNKTRARRSRTAENIAAVDESFEENPGLSIPRRSLELGIPQTSLHRILHKYLGLKAYKVHLGKPVGNNQYTSDSHRGYTDLKKTGQNGTKDFNASIAANQ